jgi:hypothetical protein
LATYYLNVKAGVNTEEPDIHLSVFSIFVTFLIVKMILQLLNVKTPYKYDKRRLKELLRYT